MIIARSSPPLFVSFIILTDRTMSLEFLESISLLVTVLLVMGLLSTPVAKLWRMGILLIFLACLSWIVHPDSQDFFGSGERDRIHKMMRRMETQTSRNFAFQSKYVALIGKEPSLEKIWKKIEDLTEKRLRIMVPFLDYSLKENQDEANGEFAKQERALLAIEKAIDALYIEIKEKTEMKPNGK